VIARPHLGRKVLLLQNADSIREFRLFFPSAEKSSPRLIMRIMQLQHRLSDRVLRWLLCVALVPACLQETLLPLI
jgi:hypothetical protein